MAAVLVPVYFASLLVADLRNPNMTYADLLLSRGGALFALFVVVVYLFIVGLTALVAWLTGDHRTSG